MERKGLGLENLKNIGHGNGQLIKYFIVNNVQYPQKISVIMPEEA